MKEHDFDGPYCDNSTWPFRCENTKHGCGYYDEAGKLHETYPVVAAREFAKRLYAIFKTHRPDTLVDYHTSANVFPWQAAWVDHFWSGEQFQNEKPSYHVPLDYFRAECVGKQYGVPSDFLAHEGQPFTLREAHSFTLLHDVLVRPQEWPVVWWPGVWWGTGTPLTLQIARIWQIQDRFGVADAQWLPYWNNAEYLQVTSNPAGRNREEGGFGSLYLRPGERALIVLSNIQNAPAAITARLDLARMRLPGAAGALDAESNQPIPIQDGVISLKLNGYDYRLVWVQ
jgi:hypothetical protein